MVIIMYMAGCVTILIYNAVAIWRKNRTGWLIPYNTDIWVKTIYQQLTAASPKHEKHLLRQLKRVETLIAFSAALNHVARENSSALYERYMGMLSQSEVIRRLAAVYKNRPNEEKAYFAYFISQHPVNISEAIIPFVEDSNIYCRVNVLKALCSMGDMHGVEAVLQFFSDKRIFVHHMLLAEDLYNFAEDKEALAFKLWGNHRLWDGNIVLAVISFITMLSDRYKEAFLPVLKNRLLPADVRVGIMRYYSKFYFQPALPVLIQYLAQTDNYQFAIEAAAALITYPGAATTQALVAALKSESWHVRYGAASTLVALGEYMAGIGVEGKDGETVGMMQYVLAQSEARALDAHIKDMNVRITAV